MLIAYDIFECKCITGLNPAANTVIFQHKCLHFLGSHILEFIYVLFVAAVCGITTWRSARLTHVLYLVFLLHRAVEV